MAELKELAQSVYDQCFPNASIQTSIKVDHVLVEAKARLAYEMWLQAKIEEREDGFWEVPTPLLREAEIEIKNNEADISSLKVFRSFKGDTWIQSVGDCDCPYMKMSLNVSKMLCGDDEYIGNSRPFVVVGKKLKFPKGAHSKSLPIVYASNGDDVEDDMEVDDSLAALVSDYLWKRFTNRLPEDRSNDSNTNRP